MNKECSSSIGKVLSALFMIAALCACRKDINVPIKNSNVADTSFYEEQVTLSPVPLKVSVSSINRFAETYNITSDGEGDYVNGQINIQAIIDEHGDFIFRSNVNGKNISGRWMNCRLTQPVVVNNNLPAMAAFHINYLATAKSSFARHIPLQKLTVGQSECMSMGGIIGDNFQFSFHKEMEDNRTSATGFITVTRVNSVQWNITSAGSCSYNSNIAAIRTKDGSILYGYYNLSFCFTLVAL